jgi:hypothetical protein
LVALSRKIKGENPSARITASFFLRYCPYATAPRFCATIILLEWDKKKIKENQWFKAFANLNFVFKTTRT